MRWTVLLVIDTGPLVCAPVRVLIILGLLWIDWSIFGNLAFVLLNPTANVNRFSLFLRPLIKFLDVVVTVFILSRRAMHF